jgi:hypothetical protein
MQHFLLAVSRMPLPRQLLFLRVSMTSTMIPGEEQSQGVEYQVRMRVMRGVKRIFAEMVAEPCETGWLELVNPFASFSERLLPRQRQAC